MLVDHREFRGSARPIGQIVDTRGVWLQGETGA
jgi:hypothetical protein